MMCKLALKNKIIRRKVVKSFSVEKKQREIIFVHVFLFLRRESFWKDIFLIRSFLVFH